MRRPLFLTLLLSALTGVAVRPAGEGPLRLEIGSPWASLLLDGWSRPLQVELAAPDASDGRTLFACRRAPTHGGLSLPLVPQGPFRLVLRASSTVRSALVVFVSQQRVGEVLMQPGAWDRYVVAVESPGKAGTPLQLGLTLRPLPLSRGAHAQEPELWVDFVEVESAAGFSRAVGTSVVAASLPLAAFALALILGVSPRWGLMAAAAGVVGALLLARSAAFTAFAVLPWAIAATLSIGAVARALFRPPAWMLGRARALLEPVEERASPRRSRLAYTASSLILGALAAALPALIVSRLVTTRFGATLADATPAFINDEIHYWLEIQSFSKVGFAGGYSVVNERPAPAAFSHFGTHGPLFPVLYGAIGRVVGWRPYSAPYFHFAFVALAVCFVLLVVRPRIPQLLLLALSLATFWPLLLFLPTNMQEGLHSAIALVLAGAFHLWLTASEPRTPDLFRAASLAFLVLVSLLRPSWSLLVLPFFLLQAASASRRQVLSSVFKAVALIWVVLAVYRALAAPDPGSFRFLKLGDMDTSLVAFVSPAYANLLRFTWGARIEHLLRLQLLIAIVVFFVVLVRVRRLGPETTEQPGWSREALFHLYNLGAMALATVLVYLVGNWADYRVLGCHLLLSVTLLSVSRRPLWNCLALGIALSNLAFAPAFLAAFEQRVGGHFRYDRQRIAAFDEAIRGTVSYRSDKGPWCNTLLATHYPFWFDEMVALPAGIGVTALFRADQLPFPAKSAYVLFAPDLYESKGWSRPPPALEPAGPGRTDLVFAERGRLRLEHLATTPIGDLYWNLDSGCR